MKIFINAGHGGIDPGAISKNGAKEKDITRKIASFLVQKLIEKGYDVEFFQQKKNLEEAIKAENSSKSHLFISLHCNSAKNDTANGTEAFYYPNSGTGKTVSELILKNISQKFKLKNRGAKENKEFRVLNGTKAPAVLLELAFLSNLDEEKILINSSFVFADTIMKGIEEWQK